MIANLNIIILYKVVFATTLITRVKSAAPTK